MAAFTPCLMLVKAGQNANGRCDFRPGCATVLRISNSLRVWTTRFACQIRQAKNAESEVEGVEVITYVNATSRSLPLTAAGWLAAESGKSGAG